MCTTEAGYQTDTAQVWFVHLLLYQTHLKSNWTLRWMHRSIWTVTEWSQKTLILKYQFFLFYILRKTTGLNKLEGIFYSMQQIKGLGQINENERQVFTLKHRDGAVVNTVICFKQYTIFFSAKPASKLLIAGGSLHSSLCCFASSYLKQKYFYSTERSDREWDI